MRMKGPRVTQTKQLEDLLKASVLRRLGGRLPSTPKNTKPKPVSKPKKKR
jgi:hypothetical protein